MLQNSENDKYVCAIYTKANLRQHYLLLQLLHDKVVKIEWSNFIRGVIIRKFKIIKQNLVYKGVGSSKK